MTGPAITFGGIGSGMDVESLIDGLVGVARQPLSRLQSRAASSRAAVTQISDLSSLLAGLKSSVEALDTAQKVGSFKAASGNDDAVTASANGNAQPGTYEIEVQALAKAGRRYSNAFASSSGALGQTGSLTIQIGTGDLQEEGGTLLVGAATATIDVAADDTLDSILQKINDSDIRVKASAFFDGSQYRIQVRGLDAGSDNALTFTENDLDLGFNVAENITQQAQNARLTIDGFQVESKTNQISQAIPGVTLALKKTTTEPFEITVSNDAEALAGKVKTFVEAYNKVVEKVHAAAGFGSTNATNPTLRGDSTLRGVTSQLSRALGSTFGTGQRNTLASIGIQLNNNGTLKLDETKLSSAQSEDPGALTNILAGDNTNPGMMDLIRDLTTSLTDSVNGSLQIRKDGLDSRARSIEDQIAREELRLVKMEDRLRKTFSDMDSYVSGQNAQLSFLLSNSR